MTTTYEPLPRTKNGTPRGNTTDLIAYWAERIRYRTSELPFGDESQSKNSVSYSGDTLYHYGRHFPLGRIIRDERGRARLVLLNGDSYGGAGGWGPSTANRQSETRSAVDAVLRDHEGVEKIIIPFSVLEAASIDQESIKPIQVNDDRRVSEHVETRERPSGDHVKMADPSGATRPRAEKSWAWFHRETGQVWRDRGASLPPNDVRDQYEHRYGEYTIEVPVMVDDPTRIKVSYSGHGWVYEPAKLGDDGIWRYTIERHFLGESIFRARVTERRTRKATAEELTARDAYVAWQTTHSHLDSVREQIRAELRLAEFGERDWNREAREYVTVREPDVAKAAALRQRHEEASNALSEHYSERPDWPATENLRDKFTDRVPITVRRWATFLSAFDYGEPNSPYFMVELPYSARNVRTVEEAIDALVPDEVRAAKAAGLDVFRQGDIFAIPTAYSERELTEVAEPFARQVYTQFGEPGDQDYRWEHVNVLEHIAKWKRGDQQARVLKTNHAATHVIHTKDGETFARGRLYHAPLESWRRPEHRVVKLGDGQTWYRLVRNTVPESRGGSSFGSGQVPAQPRAWSVQGRVD